MSESVTIWIVLAVVLFWAIGAYNRLVRLRSGAIASFAVLDEQLRHYVALVQGSFSAAGDDTVTAKAGLLGATQQFESSLRAARAHPLDAMAMRALETAHATLCSSWTRLRNEPPDLAGESLPETLRQQWEHIAANVDRMKTEFNRHVQDYNEAIVQFPARLLAWLFGFKPAHMI